MTTTPASKNVAIPPQIDRKFACRPLRLRRFYKIDVKKADVGAVYTYILTAATAVNTA